MSGITVTPSVQSITVSPSSQSISLSSAAATGKIDPSARCYLYSDFIADPSPFSICTQTGSNPTGGSYLFSSDAALACYGILSMQIDGTQQSRVGVYASYATGSTIDRSTKLGSGSWDFSARVNISSAMPATQRVIAGVGLSHGTVDTTPTQKLMLANGAAFVAYSGSGNWFATLSNSNALDEVDTGIAVSGFHTLRITVNSDASEIKFYIDGTLVRTTDSSFLDLSIGLSWGVELRDKKSGGTGTQATAQVDFMALEYIIAR